MNEIVDLVVECLKGIVFRQRTNEPAKGEWFVPGGPIRKSERLEAAVRRATTEEINTDVKVQEPLDAFEHFYETPEVSCAKRYVAHGFHVGTEETTFDSDTQHDEVAVFDEAPTGLHQYVEAYLDATNIQ